jgi:uncharacterized protein YlxW (UPF0749 family)
VSELQHGEEESVTRRSAADVLARGRRVLLRAYSRQRRTDTDRTVVGRALTAVVGILAGVMIATSAVNSRGIDLRPGRNTDLVGLVQSQSRRNEDLTERLTRLRAAVDAQTARQAETTDLSPQLQALSRIAALTPVLGPGLTVTLDDAPITVSPDGVEPDYLVVHQQDIQAVVNAMWHGGAEAMTIQGQRVIATTGVKCVGNTVVLHGIPYAPPYVITAIGNIDAMKAVLGQSELIRIYKQYVEAYGLVYKERTQQRVQLPGYQGSLELQSANAHTPGDPTDASVSGTPR